MWREVINENRWVIWALMAYDLFIFGFAIGKHYG